MREYARLCILDTLGIALAGHDEPCTQAVHAVAQHLGGLPQATLLVHGLQVPAPQAALANGTAAFSHNFTDMALSVAVRSSSNLPDAYAELAHYNASA